MNFYGNKLCLLVAVRTDIKDIPGASLHFFSQLDDIATGALNIFKKILYMY